MALRYDGVGYAHCDGHWIHKPQVAGDKYCVFEGSHPHDPDGESYLLETFKSERAAINYASERYVEWLRKELRKRGR